MPKISDYRDVWAVVQELSWEWVAVLFAATTMNIATFAPPWMVALPGLHFRQALVITQASTALSIVAPGGAAVGMAGSWAMLHSWGFPAGRVTRAVTLTGVWNQFANLLHPIVALFLLTVHGDQTALLATAAFVGAAVLGIAIAALVLVLYSDGLAGDLGELAARFASWTLAHVRKGPVRWGGPSFVRFREDAVDLLARRWHVLTLATLAGSLTVFLVLLLSLRAVGVSNAEVNVAEAFAAWSLVRLRRDDPDHTGWVRGRRARVDRRARRVRRCQRRGGGGSAHLPLPDRGSDAPARGLGGTDLAQPPPNGPRLEGRNSVGDTEADPRGGAEPQGRDAGCVTR